MKVRFASYVETRKNWGLMGTTEVKGTRVTLERKQFFPDTAGRRQV